MAKRTVSGTLAKLDNVTPQGDGWVATCPAHDDNKQSLSIRRGNKLPVVIKCFADCDYKDVWDIIEGRQEAVAQTNQPKERTQKATRQAGKVVAEYTYTNVTGEVMFVKVRYEPKDFRNKRPDGRGGWVWRNVFEGVPLVLYHLPEVHQQATTGGLVYVVEGEKDVENLRKLGVVATCSRNGGEWQQEYAEQLRGARVVIIVDDDKTGHAHGRKVAKSLEGIAEVVGVFKAKQGKDATDHIDAGFGLDDFVPVTAEPQQEARKQPQTRAVKAAMDKGAVKVRGVLQANVLLEEIMKPGPVATDDGGNLFSYEDGYWRYMERGNEIIRRTFDVLGNEYRPADSATMLTVLRAQRPQWTDRDLDTQCLNLPNGLLDWESGEMSSHSASVPSLNRIPVTWDPLADCPSIDQWMTEVFAPDVIDLVWEIVGYALFNDNPLHKAVLLHGTGRNGKGTFLRILNALLGVDNISSVTPQSLDDNRFYAAELHGKLANLVGDVDPRIFKATERFKQITGGDLVTAERKHEHPFKFTCRALMMAAFNALPRTADATEGFFSRWIVLPFSGYFPADKADPTLSARLTQPKELQGALVKAVAGLRRLMARGKFETPPSVVEAMAEFRTAADPVRQFMAEETDGAEDAWTPRSALYEAYQRWTEEAGNKPLARASFLERISAASTEVYGLQLDVRKRKGIMGLLGVKLSAGGQGGTGGTDFQPVSILDETKVEIDAPSAPSLPPEEVNALVSPEIEAEASVAPRRVVEVVKTLSFPGTEKRGSVVLKSMEYRSEGLNAFEWFTKE